MREFPSILWGILILIILIIGLIIGFKKSPYTKENIQKLILKHKILRILGWSPFIISVLFIIYSTIFGIPTMALFSSYTVYGLDAILSSFIYLILIYGFCIPVYIFGIILIVDSDTKIKKLKKELAIYNEKN